MADIALASQVIASHYAEPLPRHIIVATAFRVEPNDEADLLGQLQAGDEVRMLDMSAGWAWGYAPDGKVGYVRAEAIAP